MISASSHIERRWEPGAKWYLLTLVIHDQDDDISGPVDAYERYISSKGLSDIPFHMVESMHGRRSYEGVGLADRKRLLMSFNALVQRLPIRYQTFAYQESAGQTINWLACFLLALGLRGFPRGFLHSGPS